MNKNKRISILMFLALTSSLLVACNKGDNNSNNEVVNLENTQEENNDSNKKDLVLDKQSFKTIADVNSFAKTKTKEFENILKANKIDYILANDNSLIINKDMTYEKYTKEFSQLAYTQISTDYESRLGYLKTGLKLNIHLQESISTDNNFINAMFDVVKIYNPKINKDTFNEEIKKATSDPNDITDKDITTGVDGVTIKIYSKTDSNEREIVLSVRQELELPELNSLLKEYKTVKEFKEDSDKLYTSINNDIDTLNTTLLNSYIGKYSDLNLKLSKFDAGYSSDFYQSATVSYNGVGINGLQDEMLEGLYSVIENVLTKEKLSKIISVNDFKAYMKSLELYSGTYTDGILVDELGYLIEANSLPFLSEVSLNMSYTISKNIVADDENSVNMNSYDSNIELFVHIPVKAEGVTSL